MTLIPPPVSTVPPGPSSDPIRLFDPEYALVLAQSARHPTRIGEITFVPPGETRFLVRSSDVASMSLAYFERQRPDDDDADPGSPLLDHETFRTAQISVTAGSAGLAIAQRGTCELRANGELTAEAFVAPGDTLRIGDDMLFLCVRRRPEMPALRHYRPRHPFGEADATGFVGELPEAWDLRESVAHGWVDALTPTLIVGEGGSGKNLTSDMLRALSPLADGPYIVRDGRTTEYPELYAYSANGSALAPLLTAAAGGTLVIHHVDACARPTESALRIVLDWQHDGPRGRDLPPFPRMRIVGLCERLVDSAHEKAGLFDRFYNRIHVPSLRERRGDIPLLVRHFLRRHSESAAERGVSVAFMDDLLRQPLRGNVRELERLVAASAAGTTRQG